MDIGLKDLVGLAVRTRSGTAAGKLASFDVDADTGRISLFRVKSGGLVAGLLGDELLVPWSSVIELTPDALIVADAAVPVGAAALAKAG